MCPLTTKSYQENEREREREREKKKERETEEVLLMARKELRVVESVLFQAYKAVIFHFHFFIIKYNVQCTMRYLIYMASFFLYDFQ